MRPNRATVVVASAIALLLAGCQRETPTPKTEVAASPGKVIYDQQCSICHGKAGKGDTMIASSYQHSDLTDAEWGYGGTRDELIQSVTDGIPRTPMRGFKGALSEKEIEQVVDYMKQLSGS
jgi:cytochrome c oxidase cbb3-type subunit 3